MTRTTAVRLGIPVGVLSRRILLPVGLLLLAVVAALSFWQFERVQARLYQEQRAALRTVFELSQSVQNGNGGLAVMARNRGFDRVWVLSATGDILESNRPQEIGTRLEDRWWSLLRDLPSGLHQETTQFGDQRLELLSLNAVELGRQVVVMSRPAQVWPVWMMNAGLILVAGLVLWMALASLMVLHLRRRVERPTQLLDDRTMELVRGGTVSEAQLDRLHAETARSLGGHAECVVDLARKLQKQHAAAAQSSSQFSVLLNTIPSPVFLLDGSRRIVEANESLADALSMDLAWVRGHDLAVLAEWVPISRLSRWLDKTRSTSFGIRRMPWVHESSTEEHDSPFLEARYVTIAPMKMAGGRGHLVIIEEADMVTSRHSSDQPSEVTVSRLADSNDDPISASSSEPGEDILDAVPEDLSGGGRPGAAPEMSVTNSEQQSLLPEVIMRSAGLVAIAFNDEAETVYWSESAEALTGLGQQDVPDLKPFTESVFPHGKERKLFEQWLDSEPEDRSQELKISTTEGILSSVWRAGEWNDENAGEVGMLWTRLDPKQIPAQKRPVGLEKGEPATSSDDS